MKPPARAIVDNLVWSTDGDVWAVWQVRPFPHAHTSSSDKLGVHDQLRGLLVALPEESMLLSVCEQLDPSGVVGRMAEGVDLRRQQTWAYVCDATNAWLHDIPMYRRRYYIALRLPQPKRDVFDLLRGAAADVTSVLWRQPQAPSVGDVELRHRQARDVEARLLPHVPLRPASTGEICWLYARSLRRESDELPFDETWEPGPEGEARGARGVPGTRDWGEGRVQGVLAHLTDVVVKEGGYPDDDDRPRHRRYVRIDGPGGTSYQTVLAVADMPHHFVFPGGGGEWLYHLDQIDFPVDWCVRVRSIPNADAQVKVRRKHRDLVGQVGEYDGEMTGAPPQLGEAIRAIDAQRTHLGANPSEPELQVTILMSVAALDLPELEKRAGTLAAVFQPRNYGLARPTGGQLGLLRSMLPGTGAALVCRDYTQFMLASDLAAGTPFCGPEVGDPRGLLLGVSLDASGGAPVLFDPAFGPRVNVSPSLAAVGRLGSGKSFFLKRLCWDTVARGGQVVTIDRTGRGEYVNFARAAPGKVEVVRLEPGAGICLDPLRSFEAPLRSTVALGFLSLLAGCSAQSEEGAALAEAVDTVEARPRPTLSAVVDELDRMGSTVGKPDEAARTIGRRLAHYRRSPTGQLAFGDGQPMSLDADLIVFWAPNLALPDRDTLQSEHRSRMMLPEQVMGQAMLYLVAAVGRQIVFRDPSRFAAALYDEAWALLASPHGQSLVIEGVRDGRKHNGAIWLASQHPDDFAINELQDLLGSRFVFHQARRAIPAALSFLGVPESIDAAAILSHGLATGQCLYRDVAERVGLVDVLPPVLPEIERAFETSPSDDEQPETRPALPPGPDDEDDEDAGVSAADDLDDVGDRPGGGGLRSAPVAIPPPTGAERPVGRPVGRPAEVLAPVAIFPDAAEIDAAVRVGADDDVPAADLTAARERTRRRRRTPLAQALDSGEQ